MLQPLNLCSFLLRKPVCDVKGNYLKVGFWIGLVIVTISLASCGRSRIEQFPPDVILSRSAERMISLAGFEFLIERSGQPVYLDYEETIAFRRAEGRFVSPDRVFTNVRIITPGLVAEVQIISISGVQWETNLLTGAWQPTDPLYSFNPSLLFNSEKGIPVVLAHDLIAPELRGMEELQEIPGKTLYAIQATMQGESAYQMTYGMIDNDPLQVEVWIDPSSYDLYRFVLIDPANSVDKEDTTWQIDFWNFGHISEIESPIPAIP